MAVVVAGRRRGGGDSGDSGVRDYAIQGADRVRRRMVLPAAPLVAAGDGDLDGTVSRAVREALARGAVVEPPRDAGVTRAIARRRLVRAAESFRVDVQSVAE